jgi:hypothetical protein
MAYTFGGKQIPTNMISALFRSFRQLTERGRFRNEINKQLEEFANGDINDIEGAIVLARTGVAEAIPYLHKALIGCNVFALCETESNPKSYVSVRSPGDFRAYVVFTTRARAEAVLKESRDGVVVEQPFYHVLHAAPVGLGIIINPLDVAVRLDIDPPEVSKLMNQLVAEAEAIQACRNASKTSVTR